MFFGTHTPRLDEKGRLVLPAKFRDALGDGLVITRGQDRCLYVWPRSEFAQVSEGLRQRQAVAGKAARNFLRMLYSAASDDVPDKQGRVTIPLTLREYARLERECVVIGNHNKVEVWDAAAWQQFAAEQEGVFSDQDEEVVPGLI